MNCPPVTWISAKKFAQHRFIFYWVFIVELHQWVYIRTWATRYKITATWDDREKGIRSKYELCWWAQKGTRVRIFARKYSGLKKGSLSAEIEHPKPPAGGIIAVIVGIRAYCGNCMKSLPEYSNTLLLG
jgi:hypothetical protein